MPNPPDRLIVVDFTSYTTQATRANAISNAITAFKTSYSVLPNYTLIDDTANAAYIGYYS